MKNLKLMFALGAIVLGSPTWLNPNANAQSQKYAIRNEVGPPRPVSSAQAPTYLQDVVPILMGKCYRCHNQQTSFLNNWLDYRTAYADRAELKRRIWDSWRGTYFKQAMPILNSPESEAITEEERAVIKAWIETGATYGVPPAESKTGSKAERIDAGKKLFTTVCAACHQPSGMGLPNRFPPLAGSDFLNSNKQRAIKVLLTGLQGEVVVNGQRFNNSMPQLPLSDGQIAAALTFVYNSFGNSGKDVTPEEVKQIRANPEIVGDFVGSGTSTGTVSHRSEEVSPWE